MLNFFFAFVAGWAACWFYFFFVVWKQIEKKMKRRAGIVLDSMFAGKATTVPVSQVSLDCARKMAYAEALNWAAMIARMTGHADAIVRIEAREKEIRELVK